MDISKTFTFEAAHRLPNHKGECSRIHGHSYRLDIMMTGELDSEEASSSEGMVVDFSELKAIWKEHLEPVLDHRFFLWNDDPLLHLLQDPPSDFPIIKSMVEDFGLVPMAERPTAENLAHHILDLLIEHMPNKLTAVAVRVWETPNTWALVQLSKVMVIFPQPDEAVSAGERQN